MSVLQYNLYDIKVIKDTDNWRGNLLQPRLRLLCVIIKQQGRVYVKCPTDIQPTHWWCKMLTFREHVISSLLQSRVFVVSHTDFTGTMCSLGLAVFLETLQAHVMYCE